MFCKRVRNDTDYWDQVETFIHTHTGSTFSHGCCPECFTKQMGGLEDDRTGLTITPLP
jgi:hypothetical protein